MVRDQRSRFTEDDHARIAAAIRDAEATTSGEIVVVHARASSGYFFASAFFALLLTFAAGLATVLVAWAGDVSMDGLFLEAAQCLVAGLALAALATYPPLRLFFVPRHVRAERAHRRAIAEFKAQGIEGTQGRTGILIFLSEAEHHAEVVADSAIAAKVRQETWDAIVDTITDHARQGDLAGGVVDAIAEAGRLLTTHFPPDGRNPNELPDRLVEV